ncbi:MAG: hypothetical protein R3F02_18730 [Thiolinea sp.]
MARRTIDSKAKFIAGAVEATEGTNPGTLAQLRTRNLEVTSYDGDSRRREYDGDDGRNNPTVKPNRHTSFSFDADFAGSGDPTVISALDEYLRMAGLARAPNATAGFDYLISDPADVSSGTLMVRRKSGRDGANFGYVNYESNGVRGYVGIVMAKGDDPMFQFRDMKGSYIRPAYTAENAEIVFAPDNQEYPEIFENGNVPEFKFGIPDGVGGFELRDVCLHECSIGNYSGLNASWRNAVNCAGSRVTATPIDFTAKIGWDDSFFELVESHQGIITIPFQMMHGTSAGNQLSIKSAKVQVHDLKETDIDGELGMDLSCTFLDRPVLTIA